MKALPAICALVIAIYTGAGHPTAHADEASVYYQYVDASGRVKFAPRLEDVPEEWRDRAGRVVMSAPPKRRAKPPAAPETPAKARPAARNERITPAPRHARKRRPVQYPDVDIYTTERCGYCKLAMAYMDRNDVPYTEHDIEADDYAREAFIEITGGGGGVPVLDVDGRIVRGWNKKRFERALEDATR